MQNARFSLLTKAILVRIMFALCNVPPTALAQDTPNGAARSSVASTTSAASGCVAQRVRTKTVALVAAAANAGVAPVPDASSVFAPAPRLVPPPAADGDALFGPPPVDPAEAVTSRRGSVSGTRRIIERPIVIPAGQRVSVLRETRNNPHEAAVVAEMVELLRGLPASAHVLLVEIPAVPAGEFAIPERLPDFVAANSPLNPYRAALGLAPQEESPPEVALNFPRTVRARGLGISHFAILAERNAVGHLIAPGANRLPRPESSEVLLRTSGIGSTQILGAGTFHTVWDDPANPHNAIRVMRQHWDGALAESAARRFAFVKWQEAILRGLAEDLLTGVTFSRLSSEGRGAPEPLFHFEHAVAGTEADRLRLARFGIEYRSRWSSTGRTTIYELQMLMDYFIDPARATPQLLERKRMATLFWRSCIRHRKFRLRVGLSVPEDPNEPIVLTEAEIQAQMEHVTTQLLDTALVARPDQGTPHGYTAYPVMDRKIRAIEFAYRKIAAVLALLNPAWRLQLEQRGNVTFEHRRHGLDPSRYRDNPEDLPVTIDPNGFNGTTWNGSSQHASVDDI